MTDLDPKYFSQFWRIDTLCLRTASSNKYDDLKLVLDAISFVVNRAFLNHTREFQQPRWLRQVKRHSKINICFLLAVYLVDKLLYRWTDRSAVELNLEDERFIVGCSWCRENLNFGNFTLSFGRLRHRIVLKCVPHVQHDYFSSFNQSDHCFLASSLPLPSS